MAELETLGKREMLTTRRDEHGVWHAFYPSADLTLCCQPIPEPHRGKPTAPTCMNCGIAARRFAKIDGSLPKRMVEQLAMPQHLRRKAA